MMMKTAIAMVMLLLSSDVLAMGSPAMYGYGNRVTSPEFVCPFQNSLPATAQLSSAHAGIYTRTFGAKDEVDLWHSGNNVVVNVRLVTGQWYQGSGAVYSPNYKSARVQMRDSAGNPAGYVLLCADPTGYRVPQQPRSKEIIGSGCSMLSIGYHLGAAAVGPALFSKTANPPRSTECFR